MVINLLSRKSYFREFFGNVDADYTGRTPVTLYRVRREPIAMVTVTNGTVDMVKLGVSVRTPRNERSYLDRPDIKYKILLAYFENHSPNLYQLEQVFDAWTARESLRCAHLERQQWDRDCAICAKR